MRAFKVLRNTTGTALAASLIASPSDHNSSSPQCKKRTEFVCRPSELPVYPVNCNACDNEKPVVNVEESVLEKGIGSIRKELWVINKDVQDVKLRAWEIVDTGIAHTSSSIDFLREESNGPERYAAISIASLSGFIMGLRGGLFKRLSYAAMGGAAMASVCFPKEAVEVVDAATVEAGRYFVAGWHFAFGEVPKIPEWLDTVLTKISPPPKSDSGK